MAELLNDVERRILGVLLEKALAQPQYYPMTLNAIVAGCNQKSNRDPMMDLDEDTVWATLEALRSRGIVSRLLPGSSGRVERFKHETKERFGWEKPQRAVLAELLLRGPQTVGELRGRCTRMYPFENTDVVSAVLEMLSECDPPMVAALPRAPGRSAVRYGHKLYYPEEWARLGGDSGTVSAPAPAAQASSAGAEIASSAASVDPSPAEYAVDGEPLVESLRLELEELQGEVGELHETIGELSRRLSALEQRIDG